MQAIRDRMEEIQDRIREREREIEGLTAGQAPDEVSEVAPPEHPAAEEATADRVEEIRQSVTDEAVRSASNASAQSERRTPRSRL